MSGPDSSTGQLEVMSEAECVSLLRSNDLGRIAVVDDSGDPLIFPVNYVFNQGVVVFRTDLGTKLDNAPGAYVSFEIDGWDPGTRSGWSVLVTGIAHDLDALGETLAEVKFSSKEAVLKMAERLERMRNWPVRPAAPGLHPFWIGIWAKKITGRRFRGA